MKVGIAARNQSRMPSLNVRTLALVGLCLVTMRAGLLSADDKLTPPPYVVIGLETITTDVTWDDAVIRNVLPVGVIPAKEMTGGINIYRAAGANGFGGAYTAAYFWVDLEGLDSSDGTKARWMLAGVYSSDRVMAIVQEFFGLRVRKGSARQETVGKSVRAVGSVAGQELVAVDVSIDTTKCEQGGGSVTYLSQKPRIQGFVYFSDAFWGEICPAQVNSVKVSAPEGDPFAQFQPKRINWAIQFKGSAAVMPAAIRP